MKPSNEFYPTPPLVVDALLAYVNFRPGDTFLEPCHGSGAIYNKIPLPQEQKACAELALGVDYLSTDFGTKDVIITNPPFSLADRFIEKSLSELAHDGTMIYLQRVNYLGSLKRVPFWDRVGFPSKTPVIVPRPSFVKGGNDSCEYMWYIWDRGGRVALPDGMSHIITVDAEKEKRNNAENLT